MSNTPDEAESSAQALERYITDQLSSLSLSVPQDDVEMMARFVEEEGLERDEKLEGVKGMLEGVVDGGVLPEEGVDEMLEKVIDEQERLRIAEEERQRKEEEQDDSPTPPTKPGDILSSLTPEELKQAQKQALLRQYAYVDASEDEVKAAISAANGDRDPNAPSKGGKSNDSEEKKAAEERRRLVEEALRLDGKKKKYRKQQEVDLLAPNLNREKVAYRAQMEKESLKNAAQQRKDRDKAALDKQRADQAKAKADKQKKAAKQERRA
ncbi:uncharacterized protein L201_001381 [Kwoniella dendrophila CBS 6074]|uniref:Coiled-coil domain-containing protein 43 n=1 Tax=Kwoniella dendrophila CBS 6074 TaxID=1295534 RepID=A0AAX4JM80_9TREE